MNDIFFDLDGTLLDSSERLYRLFVDLIPECKMTKAEYWMLKRRKIGHEEILNRFYPQISFNSFNQEWLNKIEEKKYLQLDCCYPETLDVLNQLQRESKLYLLTARQSEKNLLWELDRLQIAHFFDDIFVTANKVDKGFFLQQYITRNQGINPLDTLFVSDMGRDIALGNKYHFQTVAITHGFMSREKLAEYMPKHLVDSLGELRSISHLLD